MQADLCDLKPIVHSDMSLLLNAILSGRRTDNLSKLSTKLATLFKLCMWVLHTLFRDLWTDMSVYMISERASYGPITSEVSNSWRY